MEQEKILAKINKLLNLAKSENIHEASLAMERARSLMEKHCISEATFKEASTDKLYKEVIISAKRLPQWKRSIISSMGAFMGAAYILGYGENNERVHTLYGKEANVKSAKIMLEYLFSAVERLAKNNCTGKGRNYISNYKKGCAFEIGKMIKEISTKKTQEYQQDSSAYGIVLANFDNGPKWALSQLRKEGRAIKTKKIVTHYNPGEAVDKGHLDARKEISLNDQLKK